MSNDLLWFAAQGNNSDLRARLLTTAAEEYEERDWTDQGTDAGRTIILDLNSALHHDRWALSGDCGDPVLSTADYWRSRRWVVLDAARRRDPFLSFNTTGLAVGDIDTRHGVAAAIRFLKEAWTHQQVLGIDDFFFQFHSLLRSEAWGIKRTAALHELTSGKAAKIENLRDRGRVLALIDAEASRSVECLAAVLEREFIEARERLQAARSRRYADFVRSLAAIRPIYYTLRDLYWELHFLSGENDSGEFIERERLVDEWQADMFQVQHSPYGRMVQLSLETRMSERDVRRHLAFWTRGRVQLNEEMQHLAFRAFQKGGIAAMIDQLDAATHSALDRTQVAALGTWERMIFSDDPAR